MILVTGGLGFIGSHVALSLMASGHEVIIVDNQTNSNVQILERLEKITGMYIPYVKVDLRNTPALLKVFEQYTVDAVIHTASFKSLEESKIKPLEYYNNNVNCTISLLRAMQRVGVRTLVNISSLMVYGRSSLELDENDPLSYEVTNPYIRSMQMNEQIIKDHFNADLEWQIANLRVSNVNGSFENSILGEATPILPKNILPMILQAANLQREHVDLHQYADAGLKDGSGERSFLHVLDLCHAAVRTLYWLKQQNSVLENINIAAKESHSILELIELAKTVTQRQIQVIPTPVEDGLAQVGAKIEKAERILQWQPQLDLTRIVEDQWKYYVTHFNQSFTINP